MKVLLLILLTLNLKSQDYKHFYVSAIGAVGISEVTYRITHKPVLSGFVGAVLMFGIGAGKEKFIDKSVSEPDLFDDGFGSATGSICWGVHFDIKDRNYSKRQKDFIKLNNAKRILE